MKRYILMLIAIQLLLFASCSHYKDSEVTAVNEDTMISQSAEPPGTAGTSNQTTAKPTMVPAFEDKAIISGDELTITVHNANELIYYLESGKHFLLVPGGNYDVHNIDESLAYKYSGNGIIDMDNVIIEGVGDHQVDFITKSYDRDVLQLANCKNITLKNLNFGHEPPVDVNCAGAVLVMQKSENVTVENCTMFGCGTIGIIATELSDLICRDCVIKDCAANVMELRNTRKALFEGCCFENREDEAIILYDYQDIVMKDCRLSGGMTVYPRLIDDTGNGYNDLLDKPNNGEEYIIKDQVFPGIKLLNVSVIGAVELKELAEKLQSTHEGVTASLNIGREEISGAKNIRCQLAYDSAPGESEYLPQIYTAKELIAKNFTEPIIIYVYLDWPGAEKNKSVYSTYNGSILLWDNYKSLDSVMNDQKSYITAAEAEAALKTWLPPITTVKSFLSSDSSTAADESVEAEFNNTAVFDGNAYYAFNLYSTVADIKNLIDSFMVNAYDSTINKHFDGSEYISVKHAEKKQIDAVLNCLRSSNINIPDDGTFRAYIVNENYLVLLADFAFSSFVLTEKDGILTAERYDEFMGD